MEYSSADKAKMAAAFTGMALSMEPEHAAHFVVTVIVGYLAHLTGGDHDAMSRGVEALLLDCAEEVSNSAATFNAIQARANNAARH